MTVPAAAGTRDLATLAVRPDRFGPAAGVYVITAGVAGTAWALKRLCAVLPLAGLPAAGSALLALGIGCCGLAGWAVGYAFLFAICGAAAKGIGQLFGTSSTLEREFTRIGGQAAITNAYLAALMLLAHCYGCAASRWRCPPPAWPPCAAAISAELRKP